MVLMEEILHQLIDSLSANYLQGFKNIPGAGFLNHQHDQWDDHPVCSWLSQNWGRNAWTVGNNNVWRQLHSVSHPVWMTNHCLNAIAIQKVILAARNSTQNDQMKIVAEVGFATKRQLVFPCLGIFWGCHGMSIIFKHTETYPSCICLEL